MTNAASLLALAVVFSVLNLVLLGALSAVWLYNYRTFRNRQVLALCCFAVLLAGENVAAVAFHLSMGMLYADATGAILVATGLRGLQLVALCFLAWATLR
ncbi:hypothetical protein [Natrinema pallidum]|uniref:Uncharacterized protein n=1 Tax=Natrinema pallidum DSM 3751 TaxID=1227495 RepID=L9YWY1_9EURY|nr:hypothetical protein [Natrinema pallidum]ELY78629.1 hypothetical protein C487_08312 [Natrinema pallidum DSM 3751]